MAILLLSLLELLIDRHDVVRARNATEIELGYFITFIVGMLIFAELATMLIFIHLTLDMAKCRSRER